MGHAPVPSASPMHWDENGRPGGAQGCSCGGGGRQEVYRSPSPSGQVQQVWAGWCPPFSAQDPRAEGSPELCGHRGLDATAQPLPASPARAPPTLLGDPPGGEQHQKNPKPGPPSGSCWRWGRGDFSGTLIQLPQPSRTAAEGDGVLQLGVLGEGVGGAGLGRGGQLPGASA